MKTKQIILFVGIICLIILGIILFGIFAVAASIGVITAIVTIEYRLTEPYKFSDIRKWIKDHLVASNFIVWIANTIILLIILIPYLPSDTCSSNEGKYAGNTKGFSVDEKYYPTGKMGGIDDIKETKLDTGYRFTYVPTGYGHQEWNWKYKDDGTKNREPAPFGGIMYLSPRDCWGNLKNCGYNLSNYSSSLQFEVRAITPDTFFINFDIGGVTWNWVRNDNDRIEKIEAPYPGTMPEGNLTKEKHNKKQILTIEWQSFEYDISDLPKEYFCRVVGGFSWIIEWEKNGIQLNKERKGPDDTTRTFIFEIRNIKYE